MFDFLFSESFSHLNFPKLDILIRLVEIRYVCVPNETKSIKNTNGDNLISLIHKANECLGLLQTRIVFCP